MKPLSWAALPDAGNRRSSFKSVGRLQYSSHRKHFISRISKSQLEKHFSAKPYSPDDGRRLRASNTHENMHQPPAEEMDEKDC